MRSPGLPSCRFAALLAVATLAGCVDTGAHLTLSAPDGPSNAESFRVVLAMKDVPTVRNQRVAPGDSATRDVSYFLQRTLAGAESERIDKVDGFTLRIAPDSSIPESELIPFILMYDGNDRITGIATYPAGEGGMPAPILVMRDQIDKYPLTVERATQVDDDGEVLAPGEVRVVTCYHDDQTSYASGLVWHTRGGTEVRLLFPNDGGLDATTRELDMDCDAHAVTTDSSRPDCDDTRSTFHRDAADVCDGMDTNCDGAQTIATQCEENIDCTGQFGQAGVQLCDDATQVETSCHAVASCTCAAGVGCRFCKVPVAYPVVHADDNAWLDVCYPATGTLSLQGLCSELAPCDVEVVGVRGGWKFEVSEPGANAFGLRAYGVGGTVDVFAKRPEDPATYEVMTQPGAAVGEVDLAIITSERTLYLGLELKLDSYVAPTCGAAPMLECY